jgi:hypothetical protein
VIGAAARFVALVAMLVTLAWLAAVGVRKAMPDRGCCSDKVCVTQHHHHDTMYSLPVVQ